MEGMPLEIILKLLFEADKSSFLERLGMLAVAMWFVRSHFKKIEAGLNTVAASVRSLSKSLEKVETDHGNRISALEKRVEKIVPH